MRSPFTEHFDSSSDGRPPHEIGRFPINLESFTALGYQRLTHSLRSGPVALMTRKSDLEYPRHFYSVLSYPGNAIVIPFITHSDLIPLCFQRANALRFYPKQNSLRYMAYLISTVTSAWNILSSRNRNSRLHWVAPPYLPRYIARYRWLFQGETTPLSLFLGPTAKRGYHLHSRALFCWPRIFRVSCYKTLILLSTD